MSGLNYSYSIYFTQHCICNLFYILLCSSHPTSCSSMAEIISVLFFHTMRYKVSEPRDPNNDRFVLSKGHAAPILYAGKFTNN